MGRAGIPVSREVDQSQNGYPVKALFPRCIPVDQLKCDMPFSPIPLAVTIYGTLVFRESLV